MGKKEKESQIQHTVSKQGGSQLVVRLKFRKCHQQFLSGDSICNHDTGHLGHTALLDVSNRQLYIHPDFTTVICQRRAIQMRLEPETMDG